MPQGMNALIRLESITGIPGFPALRSSRCSRQSGGAAADAMARHSGQAVRWKEIRARTRSSPLLRVSDLLRLAATDEEKPALRAVVERNHQSHSRQQLPVDRARRQRTTWGWWGPRGDLGRPRRNGASRSDILSHLRVALHVTANPQYRTRYEAGIRIGSRPQVSLADRNQKVIVPGSINLQTTSWLSAYYPLLRLRDRSRAPAVTSRASSAAVNASARA